jgi:hypothetical protein
MAFEPLLDIIREHPARGPEDGWAKIAEYKGGKDGGKVATRNLIRNDEQKIRRHLMLYHPLEWWEFSLRMVPDTWADRELRVRFIGTLTPEEALKLKAGRQLLADRELDKHRRAQAKAELDREKKRILARIRE